MAGRQCRGCMRVFDVCALTDDYYCSECDNTSGQVSLRKQWEGSRWYGSGYDYYPGHGLEGIRQMAGMRSNSLNFLRVAFAGHECPTCGCTRGHL